MDAKRSTDTQHRVNAIGFSSAFGWACTWLAVSVCRDYTYGLFVWLPFVLGFAATVIYIGRQAPTPTSTACRWVAFQTLGGFCLGLLVFAMEGVICLIMAAPIGLFFTWLVGRRSETVARATVGILLVSVPGLMSFENAVRPAVEPVRAARTQVEVAASPAETWQRVVTFSRIPPPTEWLFRLGIAYPTHATISGNGAGAVRYCHFSTGQFVEPITVWQEPRLLQFAVQDQPEPMRELSFYPNVRPAHLHGYFVSRQGQFKLTPLPNGHTLLEGTTWYYNRIKPDVYWSLWSDFIVHRIHERVLNHIKAEAERG